MNEITSSVVYYFRFYLVTFALISLHFTITTVLSLIQTFKLSLTTTKEKNVHFMIKTYINKTKSVWKFEDENEIVEWNKLQNWKFWISFKEKISTLIEFIAIKELNNLLHVEEKLTSLISKYVRCTNATFEIFFYSKLLTSISKRFIRLILIRTKNFRNIFAKRMWITHN